MATSLQHYGLKGQKKKTRLKLEIAKLLCPILTPCMLW